jgi:hypothetical protein
MNKHSLRYGNKIHINGIWGDKVFTVSEIKGVGARVAYIREDINEPRDGLVSYEDVLPVKLTPEWLRMAKFSDKDYKEGYIGIDVVSTNGMTVDFVLTKPYKMGEWQQDYAFELPNNRFVSIKSVHHLQNLFYDLNDQELLFETEKIKNDSL